MLACIQEFLVGIGKFTSSVTSRSRRSSSWRKAARDRCFLSWAQELRPGQSSLVAGHLSPEGLHQRQGADLADAEELLDVAPGEQRPVERLELADGVGDGEEPPGLRGHRESSPAADEAARR